MHVIAVGTDRDIFNRNSTSAARQAAYGTHLESLAIIIFSLRSQKYSPQALSDSVRIYPTASRSRLWYGLNAYLISRRLEKPDVVTVQDPFELGLIGFFIARSRRAAFHVQVHTDLFSPAYRSSSLLNRFRVLLARFVLKRADRIRAVSFRIQDSIEKNAGTTAPITVLPIFVDVQKFRAAHAGVLAGRFSRFQRRLLVVARLEKEKNVSLAIESFAKSAPLEACLILVGEGREKVRLERRTAQLGIASRVFFEGKTDPTPYYALADLLLVPSLYEGYGQVIIEALAAGKPVLSTDVGIAREAGAIMTDEEHFAEALAETLKRGVAPGQLQHYPYRTFDEYVDAYCRDISSAKR